MTLNNNRAPLLCCPKLCASFHSHQWTLTGVRVQKRPIWVKIDSFLSRVTLKFYTWPWKTIGHLFFATSSCVHHLVAIGEFKLELQPGNAQFGSKLTIFFSCVTLKFDRWPWKTIGHLFFRSNIKLCASFHHHMWIQTRVTVRKRSSLVLTYVTLTFDLWPWTFAWTLLLSLVISPENFIMIRWWEHSEKGVTDGQTENTICRAAWSQLKTVTTFGGIFAATNILWIDMLMVVKMQWP